MIRYTTIRKLSLIRLQIKRSLPFRREKKNFDDGRKRRSRQRRQLSENVVKEEGEREEL